MARSVRRLAHDDYNPLLVPERRRAYGGHPSPLASAESIAWAQEQLRAGRASREIAEELGYSNPSSFSYAFLTATGERPTKYRDRVEAPVARRLPGANPRILPRAIKDRTDQKPYPRFDAKKKPQKRRRKRKAKGSA